MNVDMKLNKINAKTHHILIMTELIHHILCQIHNMGFSSVAVVTTIYVLAGGMSLPLV